MSDGMKRRDFLKVAGVSSAGAALVGCSTDEVERLIPYVTPPEEITPGVATWYSTVCGECPAGCGVWVKTREGRAIKLEGNPNHPISAGALCSRGHSSLQALYDPDRIEAGRKLEIAAQPPDLLRSAQNRASHREDLPSLGRRRTVALAPVPEPDATPPFEATQLLRDRGDSAIHPFSRFGE
jgi:hypothetical protein